MNFKFSKASYSRLQQLDPRLSELISCALTVSPIDFGIPANGGLRTAAEQQLLYQQGLSHCDGYQKLSKHQTGLAVDIFAYINSKASWEKHHLSMIAGVVLAEAKNMGLSVIWGGTFGSRGHLFDGWDMPHFELVDVI